MSPSIRKVLPHDEPHGAAVGRVGGPVSAAWREGTLTRAKELESLCAWLRRCEEANTSEDLAEAIEQHLTAAREAAEHGWRWSRMARTGALIERAISNLDAAEADILRVAPPEYLLGQMPSLLNHVQRHLVHGDARRLEFERIAQRLGVKDPDHQLAHSGPEQTLEEKKRRVTEERDKIVTAVRGASSAALREQLRVRSFRNVLVATALLMTLLAVGVAAMGFVNPTMIPLCFEPEKSGQTVVVCPTAQSQLVATGQRSGLAAPDVDDAVKQTAAPEDLFIVEAIGLAAAAVAAAAAVRGIRGSSEPYGLPVALAALKLPTGAVTAFLGLLLMRGQFVPGLSALDTSAQILAWALLFGYAQQLFTRFVDQQAHSVLDSVRGADRRNEPGN
ncbi:MAG TPA: hypothetical protein VFA45_17135 [Actinomycetes bacterium]|nr:hypothetical protein [Actinomycetes bacterium]